MFVSFAYIIKWPLQITFLKSLRSKTSVPAPPKINFKFGALSCNLLAILKNTSSPFVRPVSVGLVIKNNITLVLLFMVGTLIFCQIDLGNNDRFDFYFL